MRKFLVSAAALLAFFVFSPAPATHAEVGLPQNGQACATDFHQPGVLDGLYLNGSCVTRDVYLSNSGGNGGNQDGGSGSAITLINPLKAGTSLESLLNSIMDFVIRLGTIVVIVMLVFVGYKFVAARGNDAKLVEARKMLLWTIIGALVLLGAKAISMALLATVQAIGG
jgi:hypothetical protein